MPIPHLSQSQSRLYNHKSTHTFLIAACQWLVKGCPTPKNVFFHYGKVKMYELSKMPYFYYLVNLVNSEAELFNPLECLMTYMWITRYWVSFLNNVTCCSC